MFFSFYPQISRSVYRFRRFFGIKPMQRLISTSIVKSLGLAVQGNEEAIESDESGDSDYDQRSYASDDFEFMDTNYFGT